MLQIEYYKLNNKMSLTTKLTSDNVIFLSGFLSGMFTQVGFNKKILEYPFSTLFGGCITGSIVGFGTSIVGAFLPTQLKIFIPILSATSILYIKGSELLQLYREMI